MLLLPYLIVLLSLLLLRLVELLLFLLLLLLLLLLTLVYARICLKESLFCWYHGVSLGLCW
jgi:hypothetical protein